MFILINNRRINTSVIFEYEPLDDKRKKSYSIKLKYINGTEEDLPFFDNIMERNEFLGLLDKNLIT